MIQRVNSYFSHLLIFLTLVLVSGNALAQNEWLDLDTIKAGKFDTGKMWTFDFPPMEYFSKTYDFDANQEWFDHVRMSTLRFATYCSASFVSEDGLVMTNHHCGRMSVTNVMQEGEDLHATGFYAQTLDEERPVPGLFVDQLIRIDDVTEEIHNAVDQAETDEEKGKVRDDKIFELEMMATEETGYETEVVSFYNGGKYSLYYYKRYTDVRLVMAPENDLGFYGGDYDNFTYPRYNLDYTFFRVYDEEGNPLKVDHYFSWSDPGSIKDGEPVFAIGNPGSTDRLLTVAQLEYDRDVTVPFIIEILHGLIDLYEYRIELDPENTKNLQDRLYSYYNSLKVYNYLLDGLRNPVLMQKKRDFEATFKEAVKENTELNEVYGEHWDKINKIRKEITDIAYESYAYNLNPMRHADYFFIARDLVEYAEQLALPEEDREEPYKQEMLEETKAGMFPDDFDNDANIRQLGTSIKLLKLLLGENNEIVKMFTDGKDCKLSVEHTLSKSVITNKQGVDLLLEEGPKAILESEDPFIQFIVKTKDKAKEYSDKIDELEMLEGTLVEDLGRALFEVYGTTIPPDATFTLRISDGIVKSFEYNGTIAPVYTTFYGLYDRYYSHQKKFPWSLPERWLDPSPDFDLSTPMNFISTIDIVGGSSGSPVINKHAEIVGLAFDGNIESIPGNFIYDNTANRCVAVHSDGIMESMQDMYKLTRISKELKAGKIVTEE